MSMSFYLPDLGEGLAEAEVIKWYVKEGAEVQEDDPLLSVETAKALVDVPSPVTGILKKIHVADNTIVPTHILLAEFTTQETKQQSPTASAPSSAAASSSTPAPDSQSHTQATATAKQVQRAFDGAGAVDHFSEEEFQKNRKDDGTVVGKMNTTAQVSDDYFIIGKHRKKQPEREPLASPHQRLESQSADTPTLHANTRSSTTLPMTTGAALNSSDTYETETIRGSRRTMADAMQLSHTQVAQVSLFDQADITHWFGKEDITSKMIHAICEAAKEVPRLNAWFDMEKRELHIHHHVNLGLAVDTEDGLFVPVLQHINRVPRYKIRETVDQVIKEVKDRTASPERFKRATISLSNFGAIAGRFATPMVVPPAVTIMGVGRYFETPKIETSKKGKAKVQIRKILPLSLSFDHRAATGGEGARFLKSIIRELES